MVVLDIGRLHEHRQQRTFRIGDDMTLATLDPLRHVKSTRAATFRGFHSLAVDDAGGGTKLAPLPLAHLGNQGVIDQTPQSRSTPLVEVISNGRTRRKILWQRAPLTSRARDVEDHIYDDTQIGLAWPATSARCRHKRFNQFPLLIRRIACITQFVAPILFAGGDWNHSTFFFDQTFSIRLPGDTVRPNWRGISRTGLGICTRWDIAVACAASARC